VEVQKYDLNNILLWQR